MRVANCRGWVCVFFALVALAAGIGAGVVFKRLTASTIGETGKKWQTVVSQRALERMCVIHTGDTLPDATLVDSSGAVVLLSQAVKGKTWISVIEPDCDACMQQIAHLKEVVPDPSIRRRFLFVSGADPLVIGDLQRIAEIESTFLIDTDHEWIGRLHLNAFPFSFLVDEKLTVLDEGAGVLPLQKIVLVN